MSLDPVSLLSSPILLSPLSLAFCFALIAGFARCCCPCLCLPATSTHVAYPSSHSSLHLWHCHSPLAGSPPLLAELLLLLLHSNMSHARTAAAAAAAAAVSAPTAARKYQPKRISALQALPQDLDMASSQQREKQLMDQNRLSRSLSPFSDGQRLSSPTLSHAPRCPLFISVSMRRTCVSALTVCCCVDLCACVHVCACWLLLQPQTHHPKQRKRERG